MVRPVFGGKPDGGGCRRTRPNGAVLWVPEEIVEDPANRKTPGSVRTALPPSPGGGGSAPTISYSPDAPSPNRRPRVPHFELRQGIHAVLKEEVLNRVRLLARATVFVRERPVLHALEVDLRTRLPFGCCQDVGRGPMGVEYALRSGLRGNMSTGGRLLLPREPLHKSDGPRAGVLHVLRLGATTSRGHSYGEEERRPMGPPAPNTIVGTV